MEYIPQPAVTNDIVLSDDLLCLSEVLAKNVHEVWAKNRIAEGWVYGQKRDFELKTTPCLVSYEQLPESEKEYDRNTAIETLKLVIKYGFSIKKENENE